MKHLLSVERLSRAEIEAIHSRVPEFKGKRGQHARPLEGQTWALIFSKSSTRTRVSFEVGITRLGGTPVLLSGDEVGLGTREAPPDVARTLERYVDLIVARVFDHGLLEELADAASIPVINALSDLEHPCQALADLMTLREQWGELRGRQLVFVGDGDGEFLAHDVKTGKVVFQTKVAFVGSGFPITYQAAGRQFVTFPAGSDGPGISVFGLASGAGRK